MKARERLLRTLRGEETDHVPFAPFLAYFWENQSQEVQKKGMLDFCKRVGADYLHRGSHLLTKIWRKHCDVRTEQRGSRLCTIYDTPVGKITEIKTYAKESNSWFVSKHAVETEEDWKVLAYVLENTEQEPLLEPYEEEKKNVGEDGLLIPVIAPDMKTGFESLLEFWAGVETVNYALFDYPDLVEETLYYFKRNSERNVEISLRSSAEAFIFWEDTSTTMLNPEQFRKYVLPEIENWGRLIHSENKLLIHHACGLISHLFDDMCKSCVDIIESVTPKPTGDITMGEVFKTLPANKGVIGGIDPLFFLRSEFSELDQYAERLLEKAKGKRFILANSDSCPPGVSEGKFRLLSDLVCRSRRESHDP